MELLKEMRLRIYLRAINYISHATVVEGFPEGSDHPLRCLFVDNTLFTNYLLARGRLDRQRVLRKSRILIPSLPGHLDLSRDGIDLCVAVLPKPAGYVPAGGYSFKTREHVHQVLDLSPSQEGRKKTYNKSKWTRQIICKNGFSHRISVDLKDFDFFYHRIYLPHLLRHHGPYSYIDDYDDLRSYFDKGFLLMVLHEARPVSAMLCFAEGDTLVLRRTGILEGDGGFFRMGAQSAAYHFTIQYARENGLRKVDFMHSRPFFNDGVYFYKADWGASVQKTIYSEVCVHYFIPRISENIVRFFRDNPAIVQTPQGWAGLIGMPRATNLSAEEERHLKRIYYSPGLNHLILLTADRSSVRTIPLTDPKASLDSERLVS